MLAGGDLDVAFVSSFEFLRNPVYAIVDGVCVAADGPVYSVFVAHRQPLASVREISAGSHSRTSVNLLRCLLAEHGADTRVIDSAAEAKLLIGDQAIRFRREHAGEFEFWDLGAEWKRSTDLPFVFALWLIRPETPNAQEIADRLRQRCQQNLDRLDEVIAAHPEFSREFCDRYFREHLRFTFGDAEKQGLLHFGALCEKHGLLPPNARPLRLI